MLREKLPATRVSVVSSVHDWQDAIRRVSRPLLEAKAIRPEYVDAIYSVTREIGPYYVIAPHFAMPHARPEDGVNEQAFSLLVVRDGVPFHSEENDPVNIVLMMAATGSDQHIEMLTALANFLDDEVAVERLRQATSVSEAVSILSDF